MYLINKTMFTSKYRPNKLDDFIGNKSVIQPFIKWLLEWEPIKIPDKKTVEKKTSKKKTATKDATTKDATTKDTKTKVTPNMKNRCALVSGLNGVGKSLLVELILKKHDYHMIELSIDDERDKDYINQTIKPLLQTKKTATGQENVLVVSDIDICSDYGFIASLVECIKETSIPIICICDDRYSQNIKPILNYCFDIKLGKPTYDEVYVLIYKIVTGENIKIGKSGVDKLYDQSNGDIRFILNSLQMGLRKGETHKNIMSANIFDTAGKLFSMDLPLEKKLDIYWMADDIHTLMVQENYINNTMASKDAVKRLENLSYSADALSDVDLFNTVFDYDLAPHVALNTIKATFPCNKKAQIKFPQILGKISTINKNRKDKMDYALVKMM